MTPDVTIAIATYGSDDYADLAYHHAIPSARASGAPWVFVHTGTTGTLPAARNAALTQVTTEWVIYLDADDELEPGYLAAMSTVDADVRVPHVRYVTGSSEPAPVMPKVAGHRHVCGSLCLRDGNWIVVGAQARTQLLRQVGGWRDYGWEDWDLWLRCHLAGAVISPVPGAVYRANVRPGSRGRYTAEESLRHHRAVATANGVPSP